MIRRAEHSNDKKFTIISRALAQNKSLSFQARGLLLYVLSKPSNWEVRDVDLRNEGGLGKKALASILRELKDAGYLSRKMTRKPDGTITYITEISEHPQVKPLSTVAPKEPTVPCTPQPCTDKEPTVFYIEPARAGGPIPDLTRVKEKPPTPKGVETHTGRKPRREVPVIEPPFTGGRFLEALSDFDAHLRERKRPMGATQRKALFEEMESWGEEVTITEIRRSIVKGWTSIDPAYGRQAEHGAGDRNGDGVYDPFAAWRPIDGDEYTTEEEMRRMHEALRPIYVFDVFAEWHPTGDGPISKGLWEAYNEQQAEMKRMYPE